MSCGMKSGIVAFCFRRFPLVRLLLDSNCGPEARTDRSGRIVNDTLVFETIFCKKNRM